MTAEVLSIQPFASTIYNDILYSPVSVKVFDGSNDVDVVPSPKSHAKVLPPKDVLSK